MNNDRHRRRFFYIASTACVMAGGLLLAKSHPARADVFRPYASVGVARDDNLFRLSDGADTNAALGSEERGDTYRTLEAGVDVVTKVSRQQLSAHGSVNQTRFSRYTFLDYEGGAARLRWDWTVGGDWQGAVGYDYGRSLASLDTQDIERNLRTEQHGYAEGDYRFSPRWRARLAARGRDLDNSAESKGILDTRTNSFEAGAHYLSAPPDGVDADPNYIGLRTRAADGEYPNRENVGGTFVDHSYDESEVGVVAGWRFAGLSRAHVFAGYTDRSYREFAQRDFGGATGRARFDWQAGAKTVVTFLAWRELTIADDQSPFHAVTEGVQVGPEWSITPKTTFKARVGRETREYEGDPRIALTFDEVRVDRLESVRVALEYEPLQFMRVDLSWKAVERESNRALKDYRYNVVAATLRAHF